MPGPVSRTATRMPFAWSCSVLINNSRSPCRNRAHCVDRIQDQVQDDLLQLNTIALNRKPIAPRGGFWTGTPFLVMCALRQYDHLFDRLIKFKTVLSWSALSCM